MPTAAWRFKMNQAGLGTGLICEGRTWKSRLLNCYAVRRRRIRSVRAPNGSSSNAPAIIVVGPDPQGFYRVRIVQ